MYWYSTVSAINAILDSLVSCSDEPRVSRRYYIGSHWQDRVLLTTSLLGMFIFSGAVDPATGHSSSDLVQT